MTRLSVPEFLESTQEKIKKLEIEESVVRRRKHVAAIKIQKLVRGWLTRKHLKKLNLKATIIQKCWRGYRGRLIAAELVEVSYKKMVENYYHKMATKIQALWRGYRSRKMYNYYQKKAWLKSVEDANQKTMERIEEFRKSELERKDQETAQEFEPWVHYMATKLHHFLRTKSRAGIYSDPNSTEYSEIEKFLASYQYKDFLGDLRKERLIEAAKILLSTHKTEEDPCVRGVIKKRCVATLKAKHTISKPCINSTRK